MVDDSEDDVLLIIRKLQKGGYDTIYERVDTAAAMKDALRNRPWDIIICDYKMPKFNALAALALLKEIHTDIPCIIISGTIGEETAVECMRSGAHDYFMKSNLSLLCQAVARELEDAEIKRKQKLAEEELNKLALIIRNSSEIINLCTLDYDMIFINEAGSKMLGISPDEVRKTNILQVVPEHLKEMVKNEMLPALLKEGTWSGDMQYLNRKTGLIKDFHTTAFAIQDLKTGKPVYLANVSLDITERKQAEKLLRESSGRLDDIIDFLPDATFVIDIEGKVTHWNMSMERISMMTKEDIIGKGNYEYAVPFYGERRPLLVDLALLPDDVFENNHYENVFRDGDNLFAEAYVPMTYGGKGAFMWGIASRLRDASGNIIGAIESIRDISERKFTEEELRASEDRYKALFDRSLNLVYIMDFKGRFIDANPAILSLFDYNKEEIISLDVKSLADEDQIPMILESIRETIKTGFQEKPIQARFHRKDGSAVYLEAQASMVVSNGKPVAIQGVARDITESKMAEMKLKETLESLKKATTTTIQVLVAALEARDPYTAGHQARVAHLACAIAAEMGLSHEKIDGILMAGSIHDIGKISIPAEILIKPTKLTNLEFALIKEHSQVGYEMLKNVKSPWPLAQIVHQHHERMNGTGYPKNLKAEEILMEARIMAVADVIEAMASHRPYRAGLGIEVALDEIRKNKGILYDDDVAEACFRLFTEKGYRFPS